jgi:perosamine synthetase
VIRLARPEIGDAEIAACADVLHSGMLVQGERVLAFERALGERCARAHVVACASGTAALELALAAIGVEGRDVLCPALSWPSPAHAIVRSGARPVLVDVDPSEWNATAAGLARARTKDTAAAIVIDQFGSPADHREIARAIGDLPIVVDAACAIGATLDGRPSASFGAIACLSFHPRKLITTGEGGACATDDPALAERMRVLRNHGQSTPGRFERAAGNQRMSEIAAAIGIAQLARLDAMLTRRRELAVRYQRALPRLELQAPPRGAVSNWQTFGAALPRGASSSDRDALVLRMRERGIELGRLSYALHRIGSLASSFGGLELPIAEHLDERGFALPLHTMLTDAEQDRVVEELLGALGGRV